MIERGDPLSAVTQITSQEPPKHVLLMTARASTLKIKQHMIERRHPLSAVTQVTSQVTSNQCWTRVNIDFRIPGLSHSVVKQAENSRVRELVNKIENHLDRQSLQRVSSQQNNAYNPFSATSKKMIQDMGNVELFELFETDPKTQCKECLLYWSEGIVYCTCGHLLIEIVANRGFIEYTLDLVSIPEYVIKNGRPHGHRYGKTPEKKEYHLAHYFFQKKWCIKGRFTGIHDHFLRDPDFRKSMLEHDRDEDVCLKWDDLAEEDFTYRMTESEYFRFKQNWWISLNKSGNSGP